jgi:hypothetical protein
VVRASGRRTGRSACRCSSRSSRGVVEVGYYRRSFTMFTTGGVVTDNLKSDRERLTPFT